MSQNRSVVITGYGATTPLGPDAESTWEAALAGKSGTRALDTDWDEKFGLKINIAAPLAGDPADKLSRSELKKLDRCGQVGLISTREAWARAGSPDVDSERLGLVMSSGIGGLHTLLDQYDVLLAKGARRVSPMTVPMLMANGGAGMAAIEVAARAGVHCTASACASGAEGIARGADMIYTDRADIVIAGGNESVIHPMPIAGFASMRALSTRTDQPEAASRPFCVTRDGFVLGEGAAMFVLEEEEHAKARGATIYGRYLGAGITSDAHHIAAPHPDGAGAARAVTQALRFAGVQPSDVTHVNAHGTSTPAGDLAESKALRRALGSDLDHVLVTSTKSMTGHLLGGAGAVETLFTVLALHHGKIPPTINIEQVDPEIEFAVAKDTVHDLSGGVAINNSFGFGGHNVALAFGKA